MALLGLCGEWRTESSSALISCEGSIVYVACRGLSLELSLRYVFAVSLMSGLRD